MYHNKSILYCCIYHNKINYLLKNNIFVNNFKNGYEIQCKLKNRVFSRKVLVRKGTEMRKPTIYDPCTSSIPFTVG